MDATLERKKRVSKLRKWLASKELDAAVFLKEDIELNNYNYVYYGGGLAAEEYSAIILDVSGNTAAVVQEHAYENVRSSDQFSKVLGTRQSMDQLISAIRDLTDGKYRVGAVRVDSSSLTSNAAKKLEQIAIMPDQSLTEFVYSERSRKSDFEIEQIEKAIRIGRKSLEKTVDSLKVGDKLNEIALCLKKSMLDEGAASESFATDVKIKQGVTEKDLQRLERGSLLLFDFGVRLESQYLSDMGRTIPFGANNALSDLMESVCEIKRLGLRTIRSGKTGNEVRGEIDEIIRKFEYVSVHRPGHQIGLNVHEPYEPNLAYGEENNKPLQERNVVTWEPGVGLNNPELAPVRFGLAHMEDMVLVGANSKMLGNVPLKFW
jgi:Xaa-Pro aminopeptidase